MKVCFVTGELPPMEGGVGDYTHEIAAALVSRGVAVSVVTSRLSAPELTAAARHEVCDAGYEVERVVEQWNWSSWGAISDVVERREPDVLHVQYQAAAYSMHPAINLLPLRSRLYGKTRARTAVTFHDVRVPYLFPKAGRLRWQSILSLARHSDAVIVTNADDGVKLGRHSIETWRIPIGSNIAPALSDDFDRGAERERWGVGPNDTLLCHFGFMNDRKGVDTLLRSLRRVIDAHMLPGEVRLLMLGGKVGSSDETNLRYLGLIEDLVVQLDLVSHVSWTGFVEPAKLTAGFAASDLCILPYKDGASFRHGTLMAALAHGACIVTTHPQYISGELDQVRLRHDSNAVLVQPENPDELAGAIVGLASDPERRRRLSKGAAALSEAFSWASIADRHLEVYGAIA